MKVNSKKMEAVFLLSASERFKYFVKTVADYEEVWGLYQNGWALSASDEGTTIFPFWPAEAFARACAVNEWAGYEACSISLGNFLNTLLPSLKHDRILPGIFLTLDSKGIILTIDELTAAITNELKNY